MKTIGKRAVSLMLALLLVLVVIPTPQAFAAGDAEDMEQMKTLLNSVELHPQVTGYKELDALVAQIMAPYAGSDTYTKVKAAYDWCVKEIDFSWQAYSRNYAPAYDKYAVTCKLTYDQTLQEVIPWEVANRSYYTMTNHAGVCYDYAAVFAVLTRYIGIDSYIHTGKFQFESGYGTGSGHHGWTELVLNGVHYIFDPQRDYRMSANGEGTIPYNYFGITYEKAWRYTQEDQVNAQRNSQFLSVTAHRAHYVYITASATASGTASGGGWYDLGTQATVTASSATAEFLGWYDVNGALLTTESTYSFTVEAGKTVKAVFAGEYFVDVTENKWFYEDVTEAWETGIVEGMGAFRFQPDTKLNRAMAVTILARAVDAEGDAQTSPFSDVAANTWYTASVAWAKENSVVEGRGENLFDPTGLVTREEYITILIRYVESLGYELETEELDYEDSADVAQYAQECLEKAQAAGLLEGYEDGTVRPQGNLTRAEGITLLMRAIRWVEEMGPVEETVPEETAPVEG